MSFVYCELFSVGSFNMRICRVDRLNTCYLRFGRYLGLANLMSIFVTRAMIRAVSIGEGLANGPLSLPNSFNPRR